MIYFSFIDYRENQKILPFYKVFEVPGKIRLKRDYPLLQIELVQL